MIVSAELRERVNAELIRCIRIAEQEFGRDFILPTVTYKTKGTTAGWANTALWHVDFNPILLNENVDAFLQRTVPHELAHLIDSAVNNRLHAANDRLQIARTGRVRRSVHGESWKAIMRLFGAPESRCHSYNISSVQRKKTKYQYVCDCGATMELGPKRHKKHQQYLLAGKQGYYLSGHSRCTFYQVGVKQPQQPKLATADQSEKPKLQPKGKTKIAKCRSIFKSHWSRKQAIAAFIEIGCTPAGAATYYATIRKEHS